MHTVNHFLKRPHHFETQLTNYTILNIIFQFITAPFAMFTALTKKEIDKFTRTSYYIILQINLSYKTFRMYNTLSEIVHKKDPL